MHNRNRMQAHAVIVWMMIIIFAGISPAVAQDFLQKDQAPVLEELGLEDCIERAMENNRRRPASRYAVAMAEARHRQALAGYWPQVSARGGYQRMDEDPNYIFPAAGISMPMGGSIPVTIPDHGVIPVDFFPVPEQDITLMDKTSFRASLEATWLLYDGGMRKGYRDQTESLVEMMKQQSRRTDLEIVDSVKRLYWGGVLASRIHRIGQDSLDRMEATLNLTETMYKEGSGRVKKTDWLDNKVMVESLRAMVALLEKNELMAQAALANTMGMPWHAGVKPADREIPFASFGARLDGLVNTAYRFNPDWAGIEAGILAAEGAVRTAQSAHHPKIALKGDLFKWWNDHDAGMATKTNKEGWSVGIGLEIPIFSGFLHSGKIAEARALAARIKEEQYLLKEGIGLQIRDIVLSLTAAEKSYEATLAAMTAAQENRDLNTRAYQHDLVDTEKVIRAQLMDALMGAQHQKSLYEHVALQSQLALAVGTEVMKTLEP